MASSTNRLSLFSSSALVKGSAIGAPFLFSSPLVKLAAWNTAAGHGRCRPGPWGPRERKPGLDAGVRGHACAGFAASSGRLSAFVNLPLDVE